MSSQNYLKIPNIDKGSYEWLVAVGIPTLFDLKEIGSIKAFQLIEKKGLNSSLNLLYALEGAVTGRPWYGFTPQEKEDLKNKLEFFRPSK